MAAFQTVPPTLVETMALEAISIDADKATFRSTGPVFVHLEGVYGGHFLAQSQYVASKTVAKDWYCHSLSSHFLIPGVAKRSLVYSVENIRSGKSFASRLVHIRQPKPDGTSNDIIFTALIAFKAPEIYKSLETCLPWVNYGWIFENPRRFPLEAEIDVPLWIEMTKKMKMKPPCIGVEMRVVDMEALNHPKPKHEHRRVTVYKVIGSIPMEERLALSICTHMYASDRNCMFALTRPYSMDEDMVQTASLSCSILFHADPKLLFCDGEDDWCICEGYNDRAADGRGLVRLRIWNRHGQLLASIVQDALVRVRIGPKAEGDKRMTIGEKIKARSNI